jgi:signal transduction histidine kinase/streptogramin lyase
MSPSAGVLPASAAARVMLEDKEGNLWIGTEGGGLWRFSRGEFVKEETSHASIRALFQARDGSLWVGTDGGGLNQLRARRIEVRARSSGLPADVVLSLSQDASGATYVVTQGGAITRWPRLTDGTPEPLRDVPPNAVAISSTPDGSLWIGTDGQGLWRWKDGEATSFRAGQGITSDYVTMLHVDRTGRLVVGTVEGLSRWEESRFAVLATNEQLPGGVRAFADDAEGRLWVASGDGGLHRFSRGAHSAYPLPGRASPAVIRCLLAGDDGLLWIGTDGGGLACWDGHQFARWGKEQGLWEDVLTQMQMDAAGDLWCGSPRGLLRIATRPLKTGAARVQAIPYMRSEGLPNFRYGSEFHPRSWKSREGRLLFATQKGMVIVDPQSIPPAVSPEKVAMEELRVNEQSVRIPAAAKSDAALPIGPNVKNLELAFVVPHFSGLETLRIRYRLEGLDGEWRYAPAADRLNYFNLPPGSYRFRAVAENLQGVSSPAEYVLALKVLPGWWQRPWVAALGLLAFTVLVAVLARWFGLLRLRRQMRHMALLRSVELERIRIAQDLHDELGGTLTQVTLLTELAQQDLPDPQAAGARLRSIRTHSEEMTLALDEIVWSISPRNDDLEHLVGYVSQYTNQFVRTAGLRCRQEVPAYTPRTPISAHVRHHVFLGIKETLHNIVRHAGATEVRLTIRANPPLLEVILEDDGRGFAQSDLAGQTTQGEGLANLQRRMQAVGGSCIISSEPGSGTRVAFKIPLISVGSERQA